MRAQRKKNEFWSIPSDALVFVLLSTGAPCSAVLTDVGTPGADGAGHRAEST